MDQVTVPRATVQQALEALLLCDSKDAGKAMAAITALRAALEQPGQPERTDGATVFCWLVEEFGANGNSTGRFMLDQGDLTITDNVHKARQFRRMQTAMFRAKDMHEKHGGDWRHAHHGFAASMTLNALGQPEQAEPVAWLYRHKTQPWKQATVVQRMHHLRGSDEWHEVPLYTHPPRREPLTVTDLQQALVDVDLVDPDAIDDPEGFDNGFTLQQIDALHRRLMQPTPPTTPNPQPAPQP